MSGTRTDPTPQERASNCDDDCPALTQCSIRTARMARPFTQMNAPAIRADRRRVWKLIAGYALAWTCAALLTVIIFNAAYDRARADAMRAPVLIMH